MRVVVDERTGQETCWCRHSFISYIGYYSFRQRVDGDIENSRTLPPPGGQHRATIETGCYSRHVTRHYSRERPPRRSLRRHLSTSPQGSTFTSPIGAYYIGSLYVYTSSVITPLPLDLAPRRLLVLLPNTGPNRNRRRSFRAALESTIWPLHGAQYRFIVK
jgi:hypothetical protein